MVYVISMIGISIALSILYRKEPLHPLFWMPIFLAIYGSWYYLFLVSMGMESRPQDYAALGYHLLAIVSFSIPSALFVPRDAFDSIYLRSESFSLDRVIGWLFIFLLLSYILFVLLSGATSKRDIRDQMTGGLSLLATISLVGITLMAIRAIAYEFFCKKNNVISSFIYFVFASAVFLFLGEREVIFGMSLIWFLLWAKRNGGRFHVLYFYLIVLGGVFAVASSQGLKAALVGQIDWGRVFFDSVFHSEFSAPGRNFSYLEFIGQDDLVGWRVVAKEIQRFVFSIVPGFGGESVAQWFNSTYRHEVGVGGNSGWGFTMVGSAYLAGGAAGVILYYGFIGLFVSIIIRVGRRSDAVLVSYFVIIPILIYSTRQDMSYLLNYYFKFALVFNVLVSVFSNLLLRRFPKAMGGAERMMAAYDANGKN